MSRTLSYSEAIREALTQEMDRDKSVIVLGQGDNDFKGFYGTTLGLQEKFGGARVFDTPLAEDGMTGVAIGAAYAGLRPVLTHIRMDFALLTINQLINIAAKSYYMYGGAASVPIVVRSVIGRSWGQGAQHSQGLYSFFMHIPGLKVVAPTTPYDAKGCLLESIRDDNPVMFIEHRMTPPVPGFPGGAAAVPAGVVAPPVPGVPGGAAAVPAGVVAPPVPGVPGGAAAVPAGVVAPPVPGVPGGAAAVPAGVVTPPTPPVPGGSVTVPGGAATPPIPATPGVPVAVNVPGNVPGTPATPPSSVGVHTGAFVVADPGNPGQLDDGRRSADAPRGAATVLRSAASWSAGALPPPPPASPLLPGAVSVSGPADPGHGRHAATGDRGVQSISPSSLELPVDPGLPCRCPTIPRRRPICSVSAEWSATQGDSAGHGPANADLPREPVTGAAPAGDRRDRWEGR